MEGMDDTASLTEIDENDEDKTVKNGVDKNSVDKNIVDKNSVDKNTVDKNETNSSTPVENLPELKTDLLETVKMQDFDPKVKKLVEPAKFAPKDLLSLLRNIEAEIHQVGTLELAFAFF